MKQDDRKPIAYLYNRKTGGKFPVYEEDKYKYYQISMKQSEKMLKSKEIWKDIPDYEKEYQVSSKGNIKSYYTNKILSQKVRKDKYHEVRLFKDKQGKSKLVHKLVADTYIGKEDGYNYVNHLDENKENNVITNLSCTTMKENDNYGTRNKRISETQRNTYAQRKYKNYYDKVKKQNDKILKGK